MKFYLPAAIVIILATIVSGVMIAFILTTSRDAKPGTPLSVTGTALGKIVENKKGGAAYFQESYVFGAGDPIALKVESETALKKFWLKARLLDGWQRVRSLSPASIQVKSGTANFCCWKINQPGTYTVQLFKPDGSIIPLGVEIRP